MQITMSTVLTGAKRVDFEKYQHVNLFIQVNVKNGDGLMTQQVRYQAGFSDYERIKSLIGKTVEIEAEMSTKDGRDQSLEVLAIRPVATASPSSTASASGKAA